MAIWAVGPGACCRASGGRAAGLLFMACSRCDTHAPRILTFSLRTSTNTGMKMTVTAKGQVTIPKPLRKRLGIRPGQVLEVRAERGHLVATKTTQADPVERVYGILRLTRSTDAALAALRGNADAV